jgi:hypothetical protein
MRKSALSEAPALEPNTPDFRPPPEPPHQKSHDHHEKQYKGNINNEQQAVFPLEELGIGTGLWLAGKASRLPALLPQSARISLPVLIVEPAVPATGSFMRHSSFSERKFH